MRVTVREDKRFRQIADRVQKALLDAKYDLASDALEQFKATVASWRGKPGFKLTYESDGFLIVPSGANADIYKFVDLGTRAHEIRPKRPGYPLRWQSGFEPKTQPRVIGSGAGGSFGPRDSAAMVVHHPGTAAREFSETIAKDSQKLALSYYREALRRSIR